ncbi:MAG: hypothetical protein IID44_02745 [Planctomycetes bacterium]|nr:hypothetical protein [Planctomycetota bacterium]
MTISPRVTKKDKARSINYRRSCDVHAGRRFQRIDRVDARLDDHVQQEDFLPAQVAGIEKTVAADGADRLRR